MSTAVQSIELGRGLQPNPVLIKGQGRPLVFLHGLNAQKWDDFQEGLSVRHKVYAPANAGADEPGELKAFDNVHDLVLYYDDVFRKLGIDRFDIVGHSFGGMMAAEYAAHFPEKVGKLVLISPLGLWRDDAPVENFIYQTPEKQTAMILGDPASEAVQAYTALPDEQAEKNREIVRRITSMASILHFIWPIPERGLVKRLHRIAARTLVLWGEQDKLISPSYAQDFAAAIAAATSRRIAGAGHTPQLSQPERVLELVHGFLAE